MTRRQLVSRGANAGFMFVLPVVAFLLLFVTYPLIANLILTVTNDDGEIVGLANLASVFNDRLAMKSIANSAVYVGGSVVGQMVMGTFVGLLLNRDIRGKGVFRSLILVPWVIPGAVAATTWAWMHHSDYGIIRHLITSAGIVMERGLLIMPGTVMPALIVVNIWKMFPFVAVMVLAGLKGIDPNLFEAADVDGASTVRKVWHITLPQLRGVLLTVLLLLTIWGFNSITIIYTMTRGGPANLSLIMPIHIFQQTFQYFNLNKAAAESVILFFIVFVVIVAYLTTLSEKEPE